MIKLRDYQRDAIDSIYQHWKNGKKNPLIVAPTGAGKGLLIAYLIKEAMEYPETRIICLTHRKELLEQNEAELRKIWPEAPTGFYSAGVGRKDMNAPILFAGIQSVSKIIHKLDAFCLCIIDECHLLPKKSETQYNQTVKMLKLMNPKTRFIGFTATPYRLDSGKLHEGDGALFDGIAYDISVKKLVDDGYLCEVIGKAGVVVADLSNVHKRGGEFIEGQMAAAFDKTDLVESACDEIVRHGQDRKAWLIFSSGISHAENVRDAIRARGIDCEMIDGKSQKWHREKIIEQFKNGNLRCMVNVGVLTTGFNAPICDLVALLRATASTSLFVQMVGRAMRAYPGKKNALLLDFGGNVERHGTIDDVQVKEPGTGEGDAPVKVCPACQTLVAASTLICKECGYEFPPHELNHEKTAYVGAVMSHQIAPQWIKVDGVSYHLHKKEGKPDSVRVEYKCGIMVYKEWWTPEHASPTGWRSRHLVYMIHRVKCPETSTQLIAIARNFRSPKFIEVKLEKQYYKVTRRNFTGYIREAGIYPTR